MSSARSGIWVTGLALALATGSTGTAQETQDIYDLLQSAQEALESTIREATDGELGLAYELVSRGDFDQVFSDFQDVLQGGDLETLARWFPDAQKLLAYVDAVPGLESYADWLRQRLDYAAVANEAVRRAPKPVPESQRPAKAVPKPTQPAPASKTERPAPKDSEPSVTRRDYIQDADTWSKLLADRPVPERAARLVPSLKKIFSAQGVPQELVWMAEVESTFNSAARSPAGAVGLFQLMPVTAESLGLQVKPEDQRLDPTRNSRAAARYLKTLHTRFEDWPLAIAAYNGGQGRVSKLLKSNGASNFEDIADHLPGETRMYVPKVLATIRRREGFDPIARW